MNVKCDLITVPTDKKTNVILTGFTGSKNRAMYQKNGAKIMSDDLYCHVHVLSPVEDIFVGDWVCRDYNGEKCIEKVLSFKVLEEHKGSHVDSLSTCYNVKVGNFWCYPETIKGRKVIATTDKTLISRLNVSNPQTIHISIPQLTEEFLMEFCANNMKEIWVKYNVINKGYTDKTDFPYQESYVLSVSPENTIYYEPVKYSWNKQEMYDKLCDLKDFINDKEGQIVLSRPHFDKWIEENLS